MKNFQWVVKVALEMKFYHHGYYRYLMRFIDALQKIPYSSNLKINPSTGKVGLEGSPVSDDQLFRF